MEQRQEAFYVFHGVSVRVEAADAMILEWLEFDFSAFKEMAEGDVDVDVSVDLVEPPVSKIPAVQASMHSPEYVCFDEGAVRYVDYFGKALAIHDRRTEQIRIYGEDREFVFEKLYLTILSRVGELLDRRGIHRVHALGLSTKRGASLVLLPMHGGKSTLGLSMIGKDSVQLLSDDTPLITRDGKVLPFLVRLGVRKGDEPDSISPEFFRDFRRVNREPKTLISVNALGDNLARGESYNPGLLIVGRWTGAEEPSVKQIGTLSALRALTRDCVFGLGLPQVVEFFLQSTLRDTFGKAFIAASRMYASLMLASRSECYQVSLSRNLELNQRALLNLLLEGKV